MLDLAKFLPRRLSFSVTLLLLIVAGTVFIMVFDTPYRNAQNSISSYIAIKLNSSAVEAITTKKSSPELKTINDAPFKCDDKSRPLPKKKVAIIATSTPSVDNKRCAKGNAECSYAFYLPLTSLAWRRLGYATAIVVAGDEKPWKEDGHHLNFVYKTLMDLGDITVLFLPATHDFKTGLAQVSRVFVPDMEPFASEPDTYMVTSDADLFPVTNIYDLPSENIDVRLTNGHCCDPFLHKGESVPMVALSSVGMRVSTWHSVMKYRRYSNDSRPEERVRQALLAEFGNLPLNAHRGPFDDWFRDQQIISINLHHWFKDNEANCRRSDFTESRLRWDRVGWPVIQTKEQWLQGHDAHCPLPGHVEASFKALEDLAQLLAGHALNVTVYWHKYMTLMGAHISPLDQVMKDLSDRKPGQSAFLHQPDLDAV